MKDKFPGYYRPSQEEFKKLWDTGLFIPDANVLLRLHEYSATTSRQLLDILTAIKERLWVTYQAAREYHKRRVDLIGEQQKRYLDMQNRVRQVISELSSKEHPVISDDLLKKFNKVCESVLSELEKGQNEQARLLSRDATSEEISCLFAGKVGDNYTEERLKQIQEESEVRFQNEQPPGFRDKNIGDLVLWYQVLEKAGEEKKPIIFITDDAKDDWWQKYGRTTIGPRPELTEEMLQKSGVKFYMYSTERFMTFAEQYLSVKVKPEAIEEVRDARQREEELARSRLADFVRECSSAAHVLRNSISQLEIEIEKGSALIAAFTKGLVSPVAAARALDRIDVLRNSIEKYLHEVVQSSARYQMMYFDLKRRGLAVSDDMLAKEFQIQSEIVDHARVVYERAGAFKVAVQEATKKIQSDLLRKISDWAAENDGVLVAALPDATVEGTTLGIKQGFFQADDLEMRAKRCVEALGLGLNVRIISK